MATDVVRLAGVVVSWPAVMKFTRLPLIALASRVTSNITSSTQILKGIAISIS
jgi:hypothetical protein